MREGDGRVNASDLVSPNVDAAYAKLVAVVISGRELCPLQFLLACRL